MACIWRCGASVAVPFLRIQHILYAQVDSAKDEDSESAKPKQAWQRRSIFNSYGLRRVDKTDEMDEESSHKNGVATPMQTDASEDSSQNVAAETNNRAEARADQS